MVREERLHALSSLIDLQDRKMRCTGKLHVRGGQIIRIVFTAWRMRTAAVSAAIAERARLRADCLDRLRQVLASRERVLSHVGVLNAFRAWASAVEHMAAGTVRQAEAQGWLMSRSFQAWRQHAIKLSSLRKLMWMEPSTVYSPEFAAASAARHASGPRVYRAVLLPDFRPQVANAPPEMIGRDQAGAARFHAKSLQFCT